jgi:small subunit ribosomal protein S16
MGPDPGRRDRPLYDLLALRVSWCGGSGQLDQGHNMVVIRLSRGGAKKRPFYNIVVTDRRNRRDGNFIERLGFYNPMASKGEEPLRVAFDRIEHWAQQGAQLSPTVTRLVKQAKAGVAPAAPAAA